jgi:hypothetical protein
MQIFDDFERSFIVGKDDINRCTAGTLVTRAASPFMSAAITIVFDDSDAATQSVSNYGKSSAGGFFTPVAPQSMVR